MPENTKEFVESSLVMRVRTSESSEEISEEVIKCAERGLFVSYFNSQEELNQYQLRRAAHA